MDRYGRPSIISPALLRALDDLRSEFQQALGTPGTLPSNVDRENIKATLSGGILTLVLAKREAAKPRPIHI